MEFLDEIKVAIETGHKASQVLKDVIGMISGLPCLKEGKCGVCLPCVSKEVVRGWPASEENEVDELMRELESEKIKPTTSEVEIVKCPVCDGWGKRYTPPSHNSVLTPDDPSWWTKCAACKGTGLIRPDILFREPYETRH